MDCFCYAQTNLYFTYFVRVFRCILKNVLNSTTEVKVLYFSGWATSLPYGFDIVI